MNLTLIAAISDNNVIGLDGKLPWHLSQDLKRFKDLTLGGDLIMGRKTYESLPTKPLPGRRTIVITSGTLEPQDNLYWIRSPEIAIELLKALWMVPTSKGVFVCGGAQVYKDFLPLCNRMEITRVHLTISEDHGELVLFPDFSDGWQLVSKEEHLGFDFETYERIRS